MKETKLAGKYCRDILGSMPEECLIIATGGTIDKVYFDAQSAYAVGDPQITEVLRQAHVTLPGRLLSLMRKDRDQNRFVDVPESPPEGRG